MFQSIYPKFEKGRILKSEMLENIRDFPRSIIDIMFENETDGILYGAKVHIIEDGVLAILPGMIRMEELLYISQETIFVKYRCTNEMNYLKVKCGGETREPDYNRAISQVVLEDSPCKPNELELCRFKLREGAKLRENHTDFHDFNTEFDTINRIFADYVSHGTITLAPEIILKFARELMQCKNLEAIDYSLCFLAIQNQGVIDSEILINYLNRSGMEDIPKERIEIYHRLEERLQQKKQDQGTSTKEDFFQNAILLD